MKREARTNIVARVFCPEPSQAGEGSEAGPFLMIGKAGFVGRGFSHGIEHRKTKGFWPLAV